MSTSIIVRRAIAFLVLNMGLLPGMSVIHAARQSIAQTQYQLRQIETKMSQLQSHINHTHDRQSVINRELSNTEKQLRNHFPLAGAPHLVKGVPASEFNRTVDRLKHCTGRCSSFSR